MNDAIIKQIKLLHKQETMRFAGHPEGRCAHDQFPWPCPTTKILQEQSNHE